MSTNARTLSQSLKLAPWERLRVVWRGGIACRSDVRFAFGASLAWLLFYNAAFWNQTFVAMWRHGMGAPVFMVSLFVLVLTLQATLILLAPTRFAMRSLASALFIVAAFTSYFSSSYGAIFNKDMMRNAFETDVAEAASLLTASLAWHVLLLGALPAILVWRIKLPPRRWHRELRHRAAVASAALLLSLGGLFACSADYAVYFREHKPIRFALSPLAPVASAVGLLMQDSRKDAQVPIVHAGGAVQRQIVTGRRPIVIFLVVGETARAANFQLGGYARSTNPELSALDGVVYFDNVSSCATSTALSVPCMFSHLPRSKFEVAEAAGYTNLLDAMAEAGFDVEWRDNNAGCKGVCARVEKIDYSSSGDPALCTRSYCYDEVMLTDLEQTLRDTQRDTLIVFHQIGSHGPAYAERYPPQFEIFKPACRSNRIHACTPQEVVNAYDNTIAYTDHVLSRQIALLREHAAQLDSVLIYVSDHGESLGEQGVYLHGLPYAFAPRVQTAVPMLTWMSPGYTDRAGLRRDCLEQRAGRAYSHDNLYHTVLGIAVAHNAVYDPALDMLAACRAGRFPDGHE